MGLFKKKEQKKIYLPTSASGDQAVEEARLKALEASLEFLHNPKKETPKPEPEEARESEENAETTIPAEPAEEHKESNPPTAEEATEKDVLNDDRDGQQNDEEPEEAVSTDSIQAVISNVLDKAAFEKKPEAPAAPKAAKPEAPAAPQSLTPKANPVAPAIQPSERILHPETASFNTTEEKKAEMPPVPKIPEAAQKENNAVAEGPKVWGRRMDYRTAVVKSGPQSGPASNTPKPERPIAPTAVSNIPPAPHMPQNISSKAPIPPPEVTSKTQLPAKTIVPTVPSVPDKANKPVVAPKVPAPAVVPTAATIVANSGENNEVPIRPVPTEPPFVQKAPENRPDDTEVKIAKEEPAAEVKTGLAATAAVEPPIAKRGGMNVEKQAAEKKENLIKNPLPTPKKHVAKEMDFDHQPISSQMHFDLVDMSGMDFFDIN